MQSVLDAGPERAGAALYEDTVKIVGNGMSDTDPGPVPDVEQLLEFLVDVDSTAFSGRLLSARWESPELLRASADDIGTSARYTLRRIDESLFGGLERG
jgi:hypothetical protein